MAAQDVEDGTVEHVVPHLAQQARGKPEFVEGNACVGHRATG